MLSRRPRLANNNGGHVIKSEYIKFIIRGKIVRVIDIISWPP